MIGISAAQVATRAGVSRGALERYFPTKNDLLVAVTQHVMDAGVADTKLVARGEALSKDFKRYQEQVPENARVLAKVLQDRELEVRGGT